jgi:hypothetical protein
MGVLVAVERDGGGRGCRGSLTVVVVVVERVGGGSSTMVAVVVVVGGSSSLAAVVVDDASSSSSSLGAVVVVGEKAVDVAVQPRATGFGEQRAAGRRVSSNSPQLRC